MGELHERKNHRVVIEALHKLKDSKIVYLLVGQGDLEKEYKWLVKSYSLESNVKFLGFQENVNELYWASDCFVHPSTREGFGIAPMEAMAAGLPVIVSNVNGIKDYTKHKDTGYCIEPKSVDAWAEAIYSMKKNYIFRKKCALQNRKIARKYSVTKSQNIVKKVYADME